MVPRLLVLAVLLIAFATRSRLHSESRRLKSPDSSRQARKERCSSRRTRRSSRTRNTARIGLEAALRALVTRAPQLELVDEAERIPAFVIRGYQAVCVGLP